MRLHSTQRSASSLSISALQVRGDRARTDWLLVDINSSIALIFSAAYCEPDSIRNWDCQYYCDDSFVFIDTFYELETAVLGYVGYFPAQRILAVVIRGTDNGIPLSMCMLLLVFRHHHNQTSTRSSTTIYSWWTTRLATAARCTRASI